ncbi:hypothetical protein H2200_009890 [Cladophialophora chaetospira]|uniref:Uncharacterized protein n=1 Tax=Cladophialophora chaetospira TaxID=386627 RepID=A0AA38X3A2_9EURO|nr:hypothetical protein H2200_009890 [Cladophialophora chaetospira]
MSRSGNANEIKSDSEPLVPPPAEVSSAWASPDAPTVDARLVAVQTPVPPSVEQEAPIISLFSPILANSVSRLSPINISEPNLDFLLRPLENEADINGKESSAELELEHAVRSQNTLMVQFLLESGASPQGASERVTPLSIAAGNADLEICAILLEAGADAKAVDSSSQTALHHAVRSQSVPTVRLLLKYGALSRGRGKNTADDGIEPECMHFVPLSLAESCREPELYKVLVEAVASYMTTCKPLRCTTPNHELDPLLCGTIADTESSRFPASCCFERALQVVVYWEKPRLLELLLPEHAKLIALFDTTTPLFIATWKGYLPAMQILCRYYVELNAFHVCIFGTFDLVQAAAFKGQLEPLQFLVERGADVNGPARGSRGRTALQHAVEKGDRKMVNFLLDQGADVNTAAAEEKGLTALQAAALRGKIDLVSLLLQRGADVNAQPAKEGGYTALSAAIESGSQIIFRRLIQAGANVNFVGSGLVNDHSTPFLMAIRKRSLDVIQELLDFGLNLHTSIPYGRDLAEAALLKASTFHCLPIVRLILERSSSVRRLVVDTVCSSLVLDEMADGGIEQFLSFSGPKMRSEDALICERALRAGCFELVTYLRKHWTQALHTSSNPERPSAFEVACANGDIPMCQLMLQYGANANSPSPSAGGRTPLLDACRTGRLDLAKLLTEYGADVNASDQPGDGETALWYLCDVDIVSTPEMMQLINLLLDHGADIVEGLLRHGADVNAAPSKFGYTALQAACKEGNIQIVEALLRVSADVNAAPSAYGYTALQAAAKRGNVDIVRTLTTAGADVALAKPLYGATAIYHAAAKGHLEVLELLLQYYPMNMLGHISFELKDAVDIAREEGHSEIVHCLDTFWRTNASWLSNEVSRSGEASSTPWATKDTVEDSEDDDGEDQ